MRRFKTLRARENQYCRLEYWKLLVDFPTNFSHSSPPDHGPESGVNLTLKLVVFHDWYVDFSLQHFNVFRAQPDGAIQG